MTLPEPQRGEDPTPEKYICFMDLSLLGQINKSKIKLKVRAYLTTIRCTLLVHFSTLTTLSAFCGHT